MSISVSLAPVNTEVSVSSANDITVSLTNPTTTVTVTNAALQQATSVIVTDNTSNTDFPVVFHNESNGLLDDTGSFTYNPSTEKLTVKELDVLSASTTGVFTVGRNATENLKITVDDPNVTLLADQDSDSNTAHSFILDRSFGGTGLSDFRVRHDGNDEFVISDNGGTVTATLNGSLTASQTLNNSITDTSIDASEFAAFAGTKIIYTGGAGSITLPDAVSGDVGKTWIVLNAGTGAITVKRDTNSQVIKFLNGSAVSSGSANLTLAVGSAVEIICTAADNYIAFGSGIS